MSQTTYQEKKLTDLSEIEDFISKRQQDLEHALDNDMKLNKSDIQERVENFMDQTTSKIQREFPKIQEQEFELKKNLAEEQNELTTKIDSKRHKNPFFLIIRLHRVQCDAEEFRDARHPFL